MIQQTTSLRKILALRKRIRVVRGGQGAAKTISILIVLINHASNNPDKEILIISEELTKMRLTVIKDFIKVMKMAGIYEESRFLAETLYKFQNGSFIKFIGLDKDDIGKGLRCDVAYFNEVNKIDMESYRQISSRAKVIYADYNPDAEFFIDREVLPRPDCDFLQLNFQDNELLGAEERQEILYYKENGFNPDGSIKNAYWANLWNVYGLGNVGSLQGVVFSNWDIVESIPEEAQFVAHGLDWGFTSDESGALSVWKIGNELYLKERMYVKGYTNNDIALHLNGQGITKREVIIADSSEPKSIEDLGRLGFNIQGAKKGPDSIRASIDIVQRYRMHVTKDSPNLIKELRSYTWETDRTGESTGAPVDKANHLIDPLRYVALNKLSNKVSGKYYFG